MIIDTKTGLFYSAFFLLLFLVCFVLWFKTCMSYLLILMLSSVGAFSQP